MNAQTLLNGPFGRYAVADQLSAGEEVFPRRLVTSNSNGLSASRLYLSYFTARKTETITKVRTLSGGTAAGATPTLCRVGIYSISSAGAGSLVAACASDTSLWATTSTAYSSNLSASFLKVAGNRYALAILCVTGAALPTLISGGIDSSPGLRTEFSYAPRLAGWLGSQSDLPSTFTDASLNVQDSPIYGALLP